MSDTIFQTLRADHDVQRDLMAKLVNTSGDTAERNNIFKKIREELAGHAKAEERFFYNPLIKKDLTIEKARHSIAEHKELDDLIDELEAMDFSSPAWLPKAKELQHRVEHHLEEEEHEVFQMAGKALSESQKTKLADDYSKEMDKVRYA